MAKKANKPAKAKAVVKKAAPAKAKKPAPKAKPAAAKKKPAPAKKPAVKKTVPAKKSAPAKKPAVKKVTVKKPAPKKAPAEKAPAVKAPVKKPVAINKVAPVKLKGTAKPAAKPLPKNLPPLIKKAVPKVKLSPWLVKQQARLLHLKDELLDAMNGVGRDTLRTRAEGSDASGFGMHTGDAGSDAYDRDFALSLLSQERDSLFEIDAALKKIQDGAYGLCEISGKPIPHARLEALPFARYTVECQADLEKNNRLHRVRQPVTSLFGLNEDEAEGEEEEPATESKE
ncbi:MAG: ral stress protein [Verrucomicrobiota bacterium]|jgi:DnaK suppressor protein